jgi:hypothetical protein
MLNPDQRKIVSRTYEHLIEKERNRWDFIDDYILLLEYLDDEQLCKEAEIAYENHKHGDIGCSENHSKDKCFVPLLVESIGYILALYQETKNLPVKNQYILHYYLSLTHAKLIIVN